MGFMFFFFFNSELLPVDKIMNRGRLTMGSFANIDCANVEVGGKVLRLVSVESFLSIVGIPPSSKRRIASLSKLLSDSRVRNSFTDRIFSRLNKGYDVEGEPFVDSRVITDFCRMMLSLRSIGKLKGTYLDYVRNCERFLAGLADVGLVALIDEATGYGKRQRDEYKQLFLKFIQDEQTPWLKEFQDSFFDGIYKIYNLPRIANNRHPLFFGDFIAKYVYYPLANSHGAILEYLRERNPVFSINGRKFKHHQFLTQKVGKVALRDHLSKIEAIFALSKDKGSFKRNFKKVFPQPYDQLELDFGDDV